MYDYFVNKIGMAKIYVVPVCPDVCGWVLCCLSFHMISVIRGSISK